MTDSILIIGATARAAAESARRAGLQVSAIDLFADRDLREVALVQRCPANAYPDRIPELASQLAPSPFCYLGGLENHPETLSKLCDQRALYGVEPDDLLACRDPFTLATAVQECRAHVAKSERTLTRAHRNQLWLLKPLASCGGLRIRPAAAPATAPSGYFFQQLLPGEVYSGSFVAHAEGCELLCVAQQFTTRQLGGTHQEPFAFGGCLGPIPLTESQQSLWAGLGASLADVLNLRGLFGVDTIWSPHTSLAPTIIELNPRFTASMELYDRSLCAAQRKSSALALHVASFAAHDANLAIPSPASMWCKAIVYASRRLRINDQLIARAHSAVGEDAALADIPIPPQEIERHHPVLTLIGRVETERQASTRFLGIGVHEESQFVLGRVRQAMRFTR